MMSNMRVIAMQDRHMDGQITASQMIMTFYIDPCVAHVDRKQDHMCMLFLLRLT